MAQQQQQQQFNTNRGYLFPSPSERRRIQIRPINNNIPSLLIQQRQPFLLPLSILLAYPPLLFLLSFFLLGFLGCFEDGAAFAADVV